MFKIRKGQAAMEFLMTYGWAILVVLAAIGALAYFGVLSPDNILPERCTGPAGLDCLEKASIDATAETVGVAFKQNLGMDIEIDTTSLASLGLAATEDCSGTMAFTKLTITPVS
ncbi:hypothetical protein CMO92_02305, partial [Candidatus Woesearchaeota archaeon]|nr:hypothetical protein [Candidatus Woesearchaeota archaeon]